MNFTQNGSALALPFRDGIAQMCVTSPPYYGLRDYGVAGQIGLEQTPAQYVAQIVAAMREVRRVLRDDGALWLNLGDSYRPDKQLGGIPWRVALALQDDGWILRSDVIWAKPAPQAESVQDRPTRGHEYVFLMAKRRQYVYDIEAIREDPKLAAGDGIRIHVTGQKRAAIGNGKDGGSETFYPEIKGANRSTVWTIAAQPYAGAHVAAMPPALAERCILATSRPGDIVLDPFMGSGTTAMVAIRNGRQAIGTELNLANFRQQDLRTRVTIGLGLQLAPAAGGGA